MEAGVNPNTPRPGQFQSRQKKFYDPYNGYRGIPVDKRDARPIANPLTLGGPQEQAKDVRRKFNKRYTAEDLKDNSDSTSLWNGKNSESFLFVQNNVKRKGDVVIIEVLGSLKEDITSELKRAYPDPVKPKKADGDDNKDAEKPEPKEEVAKAPATKKDDGKVYDKISTMVVEEVNKDYLMVRGRKEVVFKERKRYVELRALVSRKNIKDNDTVSSKNLLEPKVMALRY
jgi:flagellar basal body L-ring protein FlgH